MYLTNNGTPETLWRMRTLVLRLCKDLTFERHTDRFPLAVNWKKYHHSTSSVLKPFTNLPKTTIKPPTPPSSLHPSTPYAIMFTSLSLPRYSPEIPTTYAHPSLQLHNSATCPPNCQPSTTPSSSITASWRRNRLRRSLPRRSLQPLRCDHQLVVPASRSGRQQSRLVGSQRLSGRVGFLDLGFL